MFNKEFFMVFICGVICFLALNVVSLHYGSDGGIQSVLSSNDQEQEVVSYGFPFMIEKIMRIEIEGEFGTVTQFRTWALAVDVLIAISVSFFAGALTSVIERRKKDKQQHGA